MRVDRCGRRRQHLAAVEGLATIGGSAAAESLEIALWDEEDWIREEAIETLETIGGDRAAQRQRGR